VDQVGFFNQAGKLSAPLMERLVFANLGAARDDVLVGPGMGLDTAIIDAGADRVLVVTTDPFWYEPAFGRADAAWFAWHIVASDMATCGHPPSHVVSTFTLPFGCSEDDLATITRVCGEEASACGAAIVGGHTAPYPSASYPTIGSLVMIAFANKGDYVTSADAQVGDVIMITKGAPICAAPMLARSFPSSTKRLLGPALYEIAAETMFWQSSSFKDSLVAARAGLKTAVTSMHDATEGGVLNGLWEVATASKLGITVNLDAIPVPEASVAIAEHFGMDPYSAVSLGTLILTVRPEAVTKVRTELVAEGVDVYRVGEVVPLVEGVTVSRAGRTERVSSAPPDTFWPVIAAALAGGLS
jgi:hydrogenase expression/formation protein HypE